MYVHFSYHKRKPIIRQEDTLLLTTYYLRPEITCHHFFLFVANFMFLSK